MELKLSGQTLQTYYRMRHTAESHTDHHFPPRYEKGLNSNTSLVSYKIEHRPTDRTQTAPLCLHSIIKLTRQAYLSVGQTNHAFHAKVYIIEIMHKAILAHEHINKYKYDTIQDSEIHRTQHSCKTMTAAFHTKF